MNFLKICFLLFSLKALALPEKYTSLLPFVQEAPDQGESSTCLYVASTGAMELLANRKDNVRNPRPYGKYDLAESFAIHAPKLNSTGKYFWEIPVLKFNRGYGIHINEWPYETWNGTDPVNSAWTFRQWANLPKVNLPKIETIPLFVKGNRWSTNVLNNSHVEQIKQALVTHDSPVMINYNDNNYWHVILIVGYNDKIPGQCYELTEKECGERKGAFYVRDSFGIPFELRDYDWFRVKGNAAFVVKEKI